MITKKQISDKLKEVGLGNIKLSTDDGNGVSYKDHNGKMVKGIRGGSIGPMTMTNAHKEHDNETAQKVINGLKELGYESFEDNHGVSFKFTFQVSEKQNREIFFCWDYYPSNHYSMDLDSGYKSNYLVPTIKDVKR